MNYEILKKSGHSTLKKWKKDWFEELELKERDEKTIENYSFVINKFLQFTKENKETFKLYNLNSKIILQFLKWRERKSSSDSNSKTKLTKMSYWTKSNDIKVLKIFFKYIEDFNNSNFKFDIKWYNISLKKPKIEKPHLSNKEVDKILTFLDSITSSNNISIKHCYRSISFKLMLYSGLRASELCKLSFNNFSEVYVINDMDYTDLEIEGKGGTVFSNPIPFDKIKIEYEYLKENNSKSKYLINTIKNTQTNRNTIYDWMNYIYTHTNQEHLSGVHIVRHTFANRLSDSGADLSEMQDLMRHSSPLTTRVYVKRNKKRMVSAISKL
jgi:integrase/recombinase XerD